MIETLSPKLSATFIFFPSLLHKACCFQMLTMFYQCWQVWGEKILSYTRGSNVKRGKELKANKRKWSTL